MKKPMITALFLLAVFTLQAQPQNHVAGHLSVVAGPGIEQLQKNYVAQCQSSSSMPGYRVQIYNGKKSETLAKRGQFIGVFPSVPVYTLYEAPEYRVQAGDFRTRLEAEKFLKQVVREFGAGFVVKTQIKLPRLEVERTGLD